MAFWYWCEKGDIHATSINRTRRVARPTTEEQVPLSDKAHFLWQTKGAQYVHIQWCESAHLVVCAFIMDPPVELENTLPRMLQRY